MTHHAIDTGLFEREVKALRFGMPVEFGEAQFIPLFKATNGRSGILTGDQALAKKKVKLEEISSEGVVSKLKVTNKSRSSVLMVEGEELKGAHQNRVLNTSVLLKRKSETIIPVSCVERGRWESGKRNFTSSEFMHFPMGRRSKAVSVHKALQAGRGHVSDQGRVWADIDGKLARMKVRSDTAAMNTLWQERRDRLEGMLQKLQPQEDQCGLMFCVGGKLMALDMFGHPELYKGVARKLVRAALIDALDMEGRPTYLDGLSGPWDCITDLAHARVEVFPSVGFGTDYRLSGRKTRGSALLTDRWLVHLAVFSAGRSETGPHPSGRSRTGDGLRPLRSRRIQRGRSDAA